MNASRGSFSSVSVRGEQAQLADDRWAPPRAGGGAWWCRRPTERGCVRARLGDSTRLRATRPSVSWTIVSLEKSPLFRNCKLGI